MVESSYLTLYFQWDGWMDMDWNLNKISPIFFNFNSMSTKIPPPPQKKKQKNMVSALDKFVSYLLHNSTKASTFVYGY